MTQRIKTEFILRKDLPEKFLYMSDHETDTYDISDESSVTMRAILPMVVLEESVLSEFEFCLHTEDFPPRLRKHTHCVQKFSLFQKSHDFFAT